MAGQPQISWSETAQTATDSVRSSPLLCHVVYYEGIAELPEIVVVITACVVGTIFAASISVHLLRRSFDRESRSDDKNS